MPAPTQNPLPQLLAAELALLREFAVLLAAEQQALVRGELDRLMPLAEEKSRQAGLLAQAAEQRNQALATLGLAKDRVGMEAWLATLGSSAPSRGNWQALLALAAEGRTQNELNGKLIQTRLQQNQRALAALSAANDQTQLYGPDGQVRPSSSSRTRGSY